jgi:hypothetical protein
MKNPEAAAPPTADDAAEDAANEREGRRAQAA